MSKRSKTTKVNTTVAARTSPTSLTSLLQPSNPTLSRATNHIQNFISLNTLDPRSLQDRRKYDPTTRTQKPAARTRSATRYTIPTSTPYLSSRYGFSRPQDVSICVRRKTRKEVLFAKRKTKAGARSRRHYNRWSEVKC